ncbi:glycoside hydrolase family 32 protein [Rhodopirellula sp. MGV]|uniref:glycoside hydrolase family 32 protein n=1 Tax=Rhodopirellula sp. MGV TaxID=2023130 RepID=UPI000B97B420|nr:glycoside hydrolase family 32 protein [Rhodopirellula sp. MGV]OYP37536.1 hypothetical protein CGZ80_05290 [Rhodopirellula sp. MGV]PNY37941.1 hypothetical protein C2E31_05430 [Rhodopirellula baltica]
MMKLKIDRGGLLAMLVCLGAAVAASQVNAEDGVASDIVIDRFNGESYVGWMATGEAFAPGPARGETQLKQLEIDNCEGAGLACSEIDGDRPQGRLTSRPFEIERDYIAFRIAGGNYERHTCMNLLIDGEIVRSVTGWRSDRLVEGSWDVRSWKGQHAKIEIVDEASGDWGHINVDHLMQTDRPISPSTPIAPVYTEAFRPQFHLTARQWTMNRLNPGQREEGWINDLNGMIYYDGTYHVFAQRWNKCWLHFTSCDLVSWQEQEPAFWEPSLDYAVQSGHCVVDYGNTSGLSKDPDNPAMVAFWSAGDNHRQCISYSLDKGKSWTIYDQNPVLDLPERDPKVFWYEPGQHWCMILYGGGRYHFLVSDNLLSWKETGHSIPNSFECPDFFELPVEGEAGTSKWVLVHADGGYQLGSFDGKQFTPDYPQRIPIDFGDFYATQTFHNVETGDGRRIQIAWVLHSAFPDMPFSQQLSFPCELKLRRTDEGLRLYRAPIAEVEQLHGETFHIEGRQLRAGQTIPLQPSGRQFHLSGKVKLAEGGRLTFRVRGVDVVLGEREVRVGPHHAKTRQPVTEFEILIDRTSIELFVNDGELSVTEFTLMGQNGLFVRADEQSAEIESLTVSKMKSIWNATDSQ